MKRSSYLGLQLLKATSVALFFTAVVSMPSCKKHEEPPENKPRVTISGILNRQGPPTGSDSLTLADATKALVFKGISIKRAEEFVSAEVINIAGDSISFNTYIGNATAVIFMDIGNRFIGNLHVQGLNILPLGRLRDGENATIHLGALTLSGTSVIPTHDPLGNEIIISPEELSALKEQDNYFEALVKNLDADDNGTIDWANGKDKFISTRIEFVGGSFGLGSKPAVMTDSPARFAGYTLQIWARDYPNGGPGMTRILSGPENSLYPDIRYEGYREGMEFRRAVNPRMTNKMLGTFMPFQQGKYTLQMDNDAYHFIYANNIDLQKAVVPVPQIRTNTAGLAVGIDFQYRFPGGQNAAPEQLITWVSARLFHRAPNQNYQLLRSTPAMFVYDPNRLRDPKAPTENFDWYQVGISKGDFSEPLNLNAFNSDEIFVVTSYYDMLGNKFECFWEN
jgi:hypothetical protein